VIKVNYFKLLKATDWALYQYHVDFSPEEDRTIVRKGLLKIHQKSIGAYIFDGSVMYTSRRLSDVSSKCAALYDRSEYCLCIFSSGYIIKIF